MADPLLPPDPSDEALHALRADGHRGVVVADRGDDAALRRTLAACAGAGLSPRVRGRPADWTPARLREVGVARLELDLRPGDDVSAALLTAPVRREARLTLPKRAADVPALVARLTALDPHVERLTLAGGAPAAVRRGVATALVDVERSAPLDARALAAPPHPDDLRAPEGAWPGDRVVALRLQGAWPGPRRALDRAHAGPWPDAVLAALGLPIREPDGRLTGTTPWHPGGLDTLGAGDARVAVVVPFLGDRLLATSTLPALAERLGATLHSAWRAPWNVFGPDVVGGGDSPLVAEAEPGREARRLDTARRFSDALLDALDLRGLTDVVVPGFAAAARVAAHPSRPEGCRVHVLDLHLLDGLDRFDAPWTGVTVWSCFPSFVGAYARRGVPLDALRFVPYPLSRDHLPRLAPPAPDAPFVAAGNHRRDHAFLAEAVRAAALARPVHVITAGDVPEGPGLVRHDPVDLGTLYRCLAAARAVLLPVTFSPTDAAGISIAALATHAGRPVLGTTAWGLVDHLHGHPGQLVEPGDVEAFAEMLRLWDVDER